MCVLLSIVNDDSLQLKKSLTDLCGVVIHTFPMIVMSVT